MPTAAARPLLRDPVPQRRRWGPPCPAVSPTLIGVYAKGKTAPSNSKAKGPAYPGKRPTGGRADVCWLVPW